ncbi:MAG: Rieske 2Fe-2S domain-containing protein, partial [Pirellulales bacterium]
MFVHKEQLAYLLDPADYLSPEVARAEVERLFHAAWHPVALTTDFRADGDYRTFDLCGRPVLLRRHEGKLHAYLNVCSHRHCQLTDQSP